MVKDIVITCKKVRYYTEIDEEYFFEWIAEIPSIYKIDGRHDELYLNIKFGQISQEDVNNLIALFKRYKISNIKQLEGLQDANAI